MEKKRATFRRPVRRWESGQSIRRLTDTLVAEEPLTLVWQSSDGNSERLTSTMRTPGDDLALAAGILLSEGALRAKHELHTLSFCAGGGVNELNRLKAELRMPATQVRARLSHRPSGSLPQSACGLCSTDSLSNPQALLAWAGERYRGAPSMPEPELLKRSHQLLNECCPLFAATGASHAGLLVGGDGSLLSWGEDVGRHNACDKAIGRLFLEHTGEVFLVPPSAGLFVSSRLSFELAAKGLAAGVAWLASVGAPTHLAVELAASKGVPLFGFVSQNRFNRYTL